MALRRYWNVYCKRHGGWSDKGCEQCALDMLATSMDVGHTADGPTFWARFQRALHGMLGRTPPTPETRKKLNRAGEPVVWTLPVVPKKKRKRNR